MEAMRGPAGTLAVLVLVATSGCRIATVRPLEETAGPAAGTTGEGRAFDAVAFVGSIWRSEVLRALEGAGDVAAIAGGAPGSQSAPVVVRGRGRVADVDTRSRSGTARIELDGPAHTVVIVQVGPVLTGTAIRDALPALGFDRFVNQIQHADVGNELNARVERDVLSKLDRRALRSRRVSFRGMVTVEEGRPLTITPVVFEVETTP
jgi:predicted lipoprotein